MPVAQGRVALVTASSGASARSACRGLPSHQPGEAGSLQSVERWAGRRRAHYRRYAWTIGLVPVEALALQICVFCACGLG
jgi:hypothetical protein